MELFETSNLDKKRLVLPAAFKRKLEAPYLATSQQLKNQRSTCP